MRGSRRPSTFLLCSACLVLAALRACYYGPLRVNRANFEKPALASSIWPWQSTQVSSEGQGDFPCLPIQATWLQDSSSANYQFLTSKGQRETSHIPLKTEKAPACLHKMQSYLENACTFSAVPLVQYALLPLPDSAWRMCQVPRSTIRYLGSVWMSGLCPTCWSYRLTRC